MKQVALAVVACVMVLFLAGMATAQTPPAPVAQSAKPDVKAESKDATPTLSEVEALKLDKIVLSDENLQARIQQAQEQLKTLRTEAQSFIQGLQKPGFSLSRDDKGAWIYVKAEKAAEKAPEPKAEPKK